MVYNMTTKEYKADDDLRIRAVAMSAIAIAVANDCDIMLKYREWEFKVSKDFTVNKIVKSWNKIKNEVQD